MLYIRENFNAKHRAKITEIPEHGILIIDWADPDRPHGNHEIRYLVVKDPNGRRDKVFITGDWGEGILQDWTWGASTTLRYLEEKVYLSSFDIIDRKKRNGEREYAQQFLAWVEGIRQAYKYMQEEAK
jgi:hypothetical protein